MEFIAVFVVVLVAVLALRNVIRKIPILFYLVAAIVVVLQLLGASGLLGAWWKPLLLLVQRCMVALALFAVVMFIGVLPGESRVGRWLRPIRGELSIIACILCAGHILVYVPNYAERAASGAMGGSMLVSFIVAMALIVLLVLLGVTSFDFVKRRMSASAWRRLQRWAYVFFGLAYGHLLFMLLPSALRGGEQAVASLVVYSTLFAVYAVLRAGKALVERRRVSDEATTPPLSPGA